MRLGDRLPDEVVLKYYLYQASVSFGFFSPVFTLFLLYRDLSYTEIALLSSQHAVLTVVGEVPTGYVGDRIGRRNSLVVSNAAMALSIAGFVVASAFAEFMVLYALWSVALVFRSGSGDAWLYEMLRERLDEGRFTTVRGRGGAVNRAVTVVTMLAGGALYAVRPELPFVAATVLFVLGLPVLVSMPKNRQFVDGDGGLTVLEALPVLRDRLLSPPLRSVVAYVAVFFALVSVTNAYVQPVATRVVGLQVSAMGPLYAAFTLVAAGTSYYADRLSAWFGARRAVLLVPPVVAVVLLGSALLPLLVLPAFFLYRGANAGLRPVVNQFINDNAGDVGRATVLSAASMAYALVRLPMLVGVGRVADLRGPLTAVGAVAGLALVLLAAVAFARRLARARAAAE
ncbi:MFS transporter [Halorarius halobius]|uniref:MFS transporter n=1 Tax=Halorarius halobius TaxID=2962671 RepID=UPI0020CE8458|nr:MFS transporter [Halorarius halobius]